MSTGAHDVFISYSRRDGDFARRLHGALEARGKNVWIDWQDIPLTAEWWKEIQRAIDNANAFVFLISDHSLASATCAEELSYAVSAKKRLIPIVRGDKAAGTVPEALKPINWLFFPATPDAAQPFEESIAGLVSAADLDLEHVQRHTRLLVRAREWDSLARNPSYTLRGKDLRDAEVWLAAGTEKNPPPTQLHREYVLASRRSASRRERIALVASLAAFVATCVLAAVAFMKSETARERQHEAEVQARVAQTQTEEAKRQRTKAIEQRDEAERQARIAFSRQLAAQSQELQTRERNAVTVAALLAVEAVRRMPVPEADKALRSAIAAIPRARFRLPVGDDELALASVSRTGRYLAVNMEAGVRIYDTMSPQTRPVVEFEGEAGPNSFSPGERLIAAKGPNGLRVFEIAAGRDFFTTDVKDPVFSTFSADGERLIVADGSGELRIFETESGRVLHQCRATLPSPLTLAAASKDGRFMIVGGWQGPAAEVWDLTTGQRVFTAPTGPYLGRVDISADGSVAMVVGTDSLRVFRAPESKPMLELPFVSAQDMSGFDLSPDGRLLLAMDMRGRALCFFDLPTGRMVRSVPVEITTMSGGFFANGTHFFIAEDSEELTLYDLASGRELYRIEIDDLTRSDGAQPSDDGSAVVICSEEFISVYPVAARGEAMTLPHRSVVQVSYARDGKRIMTAGVGALHTWDASTGQLLSTLTHKHDLLCFAIDPAERRVATGNGAGEVALWDLETSRALRQFKIPGMSRGLAFSPDGTTLAAGQILWNLDTGKRLALLADENVLCLAYSPNGSMLAAGLAPYGGMPAGLCLYEVPSGRVLSRIGSTADGYFDVAFSADGRYLAAGLDSGLANVYSMPEGKQVLSVPHPSYEVQAIAFSADGRLFASAASPEVGQRGTVRIVEMPSGAERCRIDQPTQIHDIEFSPDGRRLAVAGDDGFVRLFHVTAEDLIADAAQRIQCNLSRLQWTQYFPNEPYRETIPGLRIPPDTIDLSDPPEEAEDPEPADPGEGDSEE